jgi:hypothetical protein
MQQPLLEEYICLVNQHDRLPWSSDVKHHLKGVIQTSSCHSQVPLTNDVLRALDMLARR